MCGPQAGANVHVNHVGIHTPPSSSPGYEHGVSHQGAAALLQLRQSVAVRLKLAFGRHMLMGAGKKRAHAVWLRRLNWGWQHDTAAARASTITGRDPEEVVWIGANLPTDKLAN